MKISEDIGRLLNGQETVTKLLEKHDTAIDKLKTESAENKGAMRTVKIVGGVISFLVGLAQFFGVYHRK